MMFADCCPNCGSDDLRPRAMPANRGRSEVEHLVCAKCGEMIAPVLVPSADPAPANSDIAPAAKPARSDVSPFIRPAAKPANVGPRVSVYAPLRSNLSACAAAASPMSLGSHGSAPTCGNPLVKIRKEIARPLQ